MVDKGFGKAAVTALLGLFLTVSVPAPPAWTDPISDNLGNMALKDATAEPAKKGEFANLILRIENAGVTSARVVRVETAEGERGEFRFHGDQSHSHDRSEKSPAEGPRLAPSSTALPLAPDEEARLDTHHIHLVVGPLKRDLKEGDIIEVTFTFDEGWSTTIPVHVHR